MAGDGDFLAQKVVHQGRFANVGPTNNGYKAGAEIRIHAVSVSQSGFGAI